MDEIAIKVENLTKIYKLYDDPMDRLKESLHPMRKKYHKDFYALKDINFEVKQGETVGIIGKNGSGKSTLLKIITGVLTQSTGNVQVNGKVSALLELGAGFNHELTGIENIYLNGTIMGYSKEEMESKIAGILAFADIGDFIYQPVKSYSSGMFARLAFAVSINVEPDILIVDEALSVGDAFFQNKCFHKMEDLRAQGITIIFVSHDLESVKQLCSKVLLLNNGEVIDYSNKDDVCNKYLSMFFNDNNQIIKKKSNQNIDDYCLEESIGEYKDQQYCIPRLNYNGIIGGNGKAEILSFFIFDKENNIVASLKTEERYTFHIIGKFKEEISDIIFGFTLENLKGIKVFASNSYILNSVLGSINSIYYYEAKFNFKVPRIQQGEYLISPAIASGTQAEHSMLCWYQNCMIVQVENEGYNLSLIELVTEVTFTKYNEDKLCFS